MPTLDNHFYCYYIDGNSSHFESVSVELAKEQNVIIFCLPPHTTHRSQPLDSCVFGLLKKAWTEVYHTYQQDNPGAVITKYSFTPLFAKVWSQSFTPNNLISGFKKCGINPFNCETIEILDDGVPAMLQVSAADEQPWTSHENSVCQDQHFEHQESHNDLINNEDTANIITDEMITKFKRRYKEGYDFYDPLYQSGLMQIIFFKFNAGKF